MQYLTDKPAWILSREEMRALLAFASKDSTRANLYAIGLAPGRAVATDGHRLCVVRDTMMAGDLGGAIICAPRPDCERALKCTPKGGSIIVARCDDGTLRWIATVGNSAWRACPDAPAPEHALTSPALVSAEFRSAAADAVYPPYDAVVPWADMVGGKTAEETARAIGVNADYLADLARIAAASVSCGVSRTHGVTMYRGGGDLDPIAFSCGEDWIAVIMPMRLDAGGLASGWTAAPAKPLRAIEGGKGKLAAGKVAS
jgi:hypothetical protein